MEENRQPVVTAGVPEVTFVLQGADRTVFFGADTVRIPELDEVARRFPIHYVVLTVTERGRERAARDCQPEPAACPTDRRAGRRAGVPPAGVAVGGGTG
jgi:hypothetical protein